RDRGADCAARHTRPAAGPGADRRPQPFGSVAQPVRARPAGGRAGGDHRADSRRAGDLRPARRRRGPVARASRERGAAMSESAGEKSFAPTEKRRRDAAGKGDVLRSRELSTAVVILFAGAWLTFAGPWLLGDLTGLLRASLVFDREALVRFEVAPMLGSVLLTVRAPLASLALPIMLLAAASQLAFGEGRWVGGNLAFKGSRINPLNGLKRMFGVTGLIEMGKGLLKIGLLGAIAFFWGR